MQNFVFYLRQAVSSLSLNLQRTLFVVFCIAVGVAAVVSLRTLGLMIGDGLTRNLQADNRADLVVTPPFTDDRFSDGDYDETLVDKGGEVTSTTFSDRGLERIRDWARQHGVEMQLGLRSLKPASLHALREQDSSPVTAITFFVEQDKYPFYGGAKLLDPAGVKLSSALAEPYTVVLSDRLAKSLRTGLGEKIQLQGPRPFRVTGILDNAAEARLRSFEAVIMPWALFRYEDGTEVFGVNADTVYLRMPPGSDVKTLAEELEASLHGMQVATTETLREQNQELSDRLTELATVMGLVSLLIGGIGIINTMLVVVGRRTVEIGVLKTIGLQGRQITVMFLVEALILGLIGSLLGALLGLGLVQVLQRVAESVFAQALDFQVFPEALMMGLVTGVLVTLVFGFLPTLSAGQIRPNVVLQPDRAAIPTAGLGRSLVAVGLLTAIIGLLVGQILGKFGLGIGMAFGAMLALSLITLIFRGVVWLIGRLPSFDNVYLTLSQRAVGTHPGRTASTLLALVVGMFALSTILFMTNTLLNVVNDVMEERLGGDVIVVPDSPEASRQVEQVLAELPGIETVSHQLVHAAKVSAINGDTGMAGLEAAAYEIGAAENKEETEPDAEEHTEGEVGEAEKEFDRARFILKDFLEHFSISFKDQWEEEYEIGEGRDVAVAADGEVVLRYTEALEWLDISVGDTLTLDYPQGEQRTVTVVGLMAKPPKENFEVNVGADTAAIAAAGVVPAGTVPLPTPFILEVDEASLNQTIKRLSEIKGVFALHIDLVNQLLTGIFEKLTALPMVVAILALFAAGVIMANTVSLAVLERRRQIGIMKAIGLQASDVLKLLLLESGMVGLLGGVIGTGLGTVMILFTGILAESPGSFPFGTLVLLVLLAVAISLAATLITAWGASREKPLIVLRYE